MIFKNNKNKYPRKGLTGIVQILLALILLLSLGLSLSISSQPTAAQDDQPQDTDLYWSLLQVDTVSRFFSHLTDRSLRFDSNGNPHIAYGGKNLYYAYYNGTSWVKTIVDYSPGVGEYAAIALDSQNRPRISYYDSLSRSLKFAWFDGINWNIQTIESPTLLQATQSVQDIHREITGDEPHQLNAYPTDAVGMYSSIALDANNEVHISYYDTQDYGGEWPGRLKYAHWNGITWTIGEVVDQNSNVGSYGSIAIKPTNQSPCISYLSEKYDNLKYACKRADGTWKQETVDTTTGVGDYTSLAFNSSGIPSISYYDFGGANLKYATIKNDVWDIKVVDSAGSVGWYTSVAVNSSGKVYISYLDHTNNTLKYVTSSSWTPATIANVGPNALYTSIGLTNDSRPGVVYYRSDNANLYYTVYNGSKWVTTSLDISGNVGAYTSLDINSAGNPYIGYLGVALDDLKMAYSFIQNWNVANVLPSADQVGKNVSLKLDSNNRPRLAYYDLTNKDLKLASWNGSAWQVQIVDPSANDVGQYVSLTLDVSNNPHLSYYDATEGSLKYAYWNGSAFVIQVVDGCEASSCVGTSGDKGKYSSIDLDIYGRPAISYYDATNGDLKFVYKSVTNSWIFDTVDTAGDVGQFTSLLVDSNNYYHVSYYDVTNGDLKYAQYSFQWFTDVVDSAGDVGQYSSVAVDSFTKAHIAYYDATNGDLKYASGYMDAWVPETVAWEYTVGLYPSIDLNSAGLPAISFYNYTMGELWVAMSYTLPDMPYKLRMPYAAKD